MDNKERTENYFCYSPKSAFDDQDFLIAEFHPGEVVDVVVGFALPVGVDAGEVIVAEAGGVEFRSGNFHFLSAWAHEGVEDFAVAVEVAVGLFDHTKGGFPAGYIGGIFAFDATESFIASAGQWIAAVFALAVHFRRV